MNKHPNFPDVQVQNCDCCADPEFMGIRIHKAPTNAYMIPVVGRIKILLGAQQRGMADNGWYVCLFGIVISFAWRRGRA